jgi:hypothetical protein
VSDGLVTLRRVLMRLRNNNQDGFYSVGADGKYAGNAVWSTAGLPQVTPEELDELMELAGITPDPIVPNGTCHECIHAQPNGKNRGRSRPCSGCSRPKMTDFEPMGPDDKRTEPHWRTSDSCFCRVCREKDQPWTRWAKDLAEDLKEA